MQPQPQLESRLATVLMGELLRPHDLGGAVADLDDTFVDIVLDDLELEEPDDYYASFEVVGELALPESNVATAEFVRVRDTTHDHITTIKFAREAIDADTLPVPRHSAPYELIDIQDSTHTLANAPVAAQFTAYPGVKHPPGASARSIAADPLRFPLYSAPYERVDQDRSHAFVRAAPDDDRAPSASTAPSLPSNVPSNVVDWFSESTDIIAPRSSARVIVLISVLVGALGLGLGIALLAI
jgi:hypothetical protein